MSPEQEDQIKEVWQVFDQDGSGSIERDELELVLNKLGLKPSEAEMQELIEEIDKDGDGTIDYSEFLRLMASKLKDAHTEEELGEAYRVFDIKNRKRFGAKELTEIAKGLKCGFSEDEINEMIAVADVRGEGYVCFEDFVRVILMHE